MGKKSRRRKVVQPGPKHLAAVASGQLVIVPRIQTTARLLDTAIFLWFLEKDPLPIHLITMAAYRCLEDLGSKSGRGPRLRSQLDQKQFDTVYDFLRHSSSNPNTGIGFVPSLNAPVLFDAVAAFDRIFGNLTIYMRTFWAFFVLHPDHPDPHAREHMLVHASEFMPEGLSVDEAMKLGRLEFFAKVTEMFAVQYRA